MMKAPLALALLAATLPVAATAREQRPSYVVFKAAAATSASTGSVPAGPVVSKQRRLSGVPVAVPITVGVLGAFGLAAVLIGGGNDTSPN
jgi:hypothetical protein